MYKEIWTVEPALQLPYSGTKDKYKNNYFINKIFVQNIDTGNAYNYQTSLF